MAVIIGLDAMHEEWAPYPESPDEEYGIRPITDEMIKDWNKQTTKTTWKNHEQVEKRDDDRYYALFCDQLFAGWRGAIYLTIEDAKARRTSECNLDLKIKFMNTQGDRFNWAVNFSRDMGSRIAQKIESTRETFRHQDGIPARLSGVEMQ